jgi:tetratricopeptide (TPR) repeat protein
MLISSRAWRGAGLAFSLVVLVAPFPSARASDFWDEVRVPGLPGYRAAVARAEVALRARHFADALTFADHALEQRDDRPEAHRLRGLALGALGRDADAIPSLARALELDVSAFDDPVSGAVAAHIAVRAEAWALAERILHRAAAAMAPHPARKGLYADYGDVLLTLGPAHLEASIRAYEVALRDGHGHDPRAALGLALALHRDGRPEEAEPLIDALRRTVRMEAVLAAVAAPLAERKARIALLREAAGARDEARAAWAAATERSEWAEHARAQVARREALR